MLNVNLKEIILEALFSQREKLSSQKAIDNYLSSGDYSAELYRSFLEETIFGEEDLLEKMLASLGLHVTDISSNEFRDFQHETVEICLWFFQKQFVKLKEANG